MTPELLAAVPEVALVLVDPPAPATPTTWLVVSAEQPLVADAVRVALVRRGLEVDVVDWPTSEDAPDGMPGTRPRGVGIALADMAIESEVDDLRRLVERVRVRWLLLANHGPNPLWGAALLQGVEAVFPSSTGLDDLVHLVERAASGERLLDEHRAEALREAWQGVVETDLVRTRMRSLSEREVQVLAMLYAGTGVGEIAAELAVSTSTIRSHVAAVLRKLGVTSQLRAVAVYAEYLGRTDR